MSQPTEQVFQALASSARRQILIFLAKSELTAGEIAERFDMSKPAVSKHLSILQNAGLIEGDKQGQFVHYRLLDQHLAKTVNQFLSAVRPAVGSTAKPKAPEMKSKRSPRRKIQRHG